MLAIFKREFKSYFQNVIGWLFVAALLAVYGLYFYVYNLKNGYPYISYDLKGIGFIMMIAVPILTMRSLSDEKKTKTDQLMLTSPVSVGRIVAGKYLAMAAVYTILCDGYFAFMFLDDSIYPEEKMGIFKEDDRHRSIFSRNDCHNVCNLCGCKSCSDSASC